MMMMMMMTTMMMMVVVMMMIDDDNHIHDDDDDNHIHDDDDGDDTNYFVSLYYFRSFIKRYRTNREQALNVARRASSMGLNGSNMSSGNLRRDSSASKASRQVNGIGSMRWYYMTRSPLGTGSIQYTVL